MFIFIFIFIQVSITPVRTDSVSNSIPMSSYNTSLSNQTINTHSSGKPSLTLIRTPSTSNWPNQSQQQQTYIMAQKPNNGKPLNNLSRQQLSSNQINSMINRVKQDPSVDDQQQSNINESKQQLMFSPLLNKTSLNRQPTTTTTFVQQQQWYTTTSQQPPNPPPNYTAATSALYAPILQQQTTSQPSPQTLLAPLRPNSSTPPPPPNYMARTSSAPNLTRPSLIRQSQFTSQQ